MTLPLPLMPKREIVKVARAGTDRTDDAVLKTLKSNRAISAGIRVQSAALAGRMAGSGYLYCALNQEAARALRHKDKRMAERYAKAAARIEQKAATRQLAKLIGDHGIDVHAASLADALAGPELVKLTRTVSRMIETELRKMPRDPRVTVLAGRVFDISGPGAVIEIDGTGARIQVPRSLLDEEGLSRKGAAIGARMELAGEGAMLMIVEPMVDTPYPDQVTKATEPMVDMYGTAWGQVLTADDGPFVSDLLAGAAKRPPRPRRKLIPIDG